MTFRDRMSTNNLESILNAGRQAEENDSKFYQLMRVENAEFFVEFRFNNGIRVAFAYDRLTWVNYTPEQLVLEFMGTKVVVEGRGLLDLFLAIKSKKVSWIKEADSDLQDNDSNAVFVKEIAVYPPEDELEED
jgi:hypothetical protein